MNAIYKLDLAKINELQADSIVDALHRSRQAHNVDIIIRKDGKETRLEADWLKHLHLFCLDGCGDQANSPLACAITRKP